jgi:uncharacterized protein involved in exopolysaccharide biosynthesis
MAALGGMISATLAFSLRPMYTATAVIMPPQQQQSSAASLLGQLGPLAGVAERDLGLRNPTEIYIGILGSRTIADDLIDTFGLRELYGAKTRMETRRILAGRSKFSSSKGSLITIDVADSEPRRAADLVNAYVDELHKQTNRLALTESAQRRLFFEQKMEDENKALANAEVALEATQERTGAVQVSAQVETVIKAMAQLRAEIASREVALASLRRAATPQHPEVVRQEAELASLRGQLEKLQSRPEVEHAGDPLIPVLEMPKVGLQYVRALRDLKYHETLFELTSKQYEVARLDEAKETPVIQVVDRALPPEKKSWPPRADLTMAGVFLGGAFGCFLAWSRTRLRTSQNVDLLRLKDALLRGTYSS